LLFPAILSFTFCICVVLGVRFFFFFCPSVCLLLIFGCYFTLISLCTLLFIFACILICLCSLCGHFYFSITCAVIASSKSDPVVCSLPSLLSFPHTPSSTPWNPPLESSLALISGAKASIDSGTTKFGEGRVMASSA
jgi:hypothetical protein